MSCRRAAACQQWSNHGLAYRYRHRSGGASSSNSTAQQAAANGANESKSIFGSLRQDTLTQKATPFSTAMKESFPYLVAWNAYHLFSESVDGVVRRLPSSGEAHTPVPRDLLGQLKGPEAWVLPGVAVVPGRGKGIYDFSGPDRQAKVVAGYALDLGGQSMHYEVNGEPVASLLLKRGVYTLGAGPSGESQYMVCQGQVEACTGAFACRDMLLTEGKSVAEAMALLARDRQGQSFGGGNLEALIDEICDRWTARPLVVPLEGLPSETALQQLKAHLDEHGPCMLGIDHEKWVMLDSLEQLSPDH